MKVTFQILTAGLFFLISFKANANAIDVATCTVSLSLPGAKPVNVVENKKFRFEIGGDDKSSTIELGTYNGTVITLRAPFTAAFPVLLLKAKSNLVSIETQRELAQLKNSMIILVVESPKTGNLYVGCEINFNSLL